MTPTPSNPFKPGAGVFPPELAGRAELVADVLSMLMNARINGTYQRPMLLVGRRGMGKTVLLSEFADSAQRMKLFVIQVEATTSKSLTVTLTRGIHSALRRYASVGDLAKSSWKRALSVFRSFQLKVDPTGSYSLGVDVDAAAGFADSGDLGEDLTELLLAVGEAALDSQSAILVCIDELQVASASELNALNVALHRAGQGKSPVPIFAIGAGLPSLLARITSSTAYAERLWDPQDIGPLDDSQAASALQIPTEGVGVSWDDEALDAAVRASRGYPFFIQTFGQEIWAARTGEMISEDDVETGIERALAKLDASLYNTRWTSATPAERRFLTAMADDDDAPSATSEIARRLGKDGTPAISRIRDALIKKNLIFTTDRGYVSYTVPGMAEYIQLRLIED